MNESILNGVLVFSIFQSVLFSFLFSTRKNKSLPDRLMGIWLLLLAIQALLILVQHNYQVNRFFSIMPVLITLLYGSVLYLYVSKISSGSSSFLLKELLHFGPFIVFTFINAIFPASVNFMKLLAATSSLLGIVYCFISLYALNRHRKNISNCFSFTEKINLSWLYKLIIGLIIIWTGVGVLVFLRRFLNVDLSLDWFYSAIPLFIFYIGYHGIKQQVIFSGGSIVEEPLKPDSFQTKQVSGSDAYKKSGLQPDRMQVIHAKMVQAMQSEKLYLRSTLSLHEMSDELNIPSYYITQTLSEFSKQNFYDFVNFYRIDEFKKRISEGAAENFSLLGIAFDCGFNSKSSFNRIFKNTTGRTPSEYKKNHSLTV